VDVDADTVRVFWRVANASGPLTLHVYTESKTERMQVGEVLEQMFAPEPSDDQSRVPVGGLFLELTGHGDALCRYSLVGSALDDAEARSHGLSRRQMSIQVRTVKLMAFDYEKGTHNLQEQLT